MFDLKSFRKDNRLFQKDIATLLGCTQVNVSLIESGARLLTAEQMSILIEKFGEDNVMKYFNDNQSSQQEYGELSYEALLAIVKEQATQITRFQEQITKFQEQIDSFIKVIEKMYDRK